MDKTERNKENKIANGDTQEPTLKFRIAPERVGDLRQIILNLDREYQSLLTAVDKKLVSPFSDKWHYALNKKIVEIEYNVARNDYVTFYALEFLESRLSTLETIVKEMAEKVASDIPTLKTQIETLHKTIEQPAIAETLGFIQWVKQQGEEGKRRQKEYVK